MTLGVIATITILEGKNAEFEQLFSELTKQVLANEPGALLYALHRSKSDTQVYKVLEQYASQEDIKAHGQTEYFKEANKKMAGLVAAAPDIEVLDAVEFLNKRNFTGGRHVKKSDSYRLYGITHSLYTGRARSYLIKSGIPFRELSSGHESFKAEVLPESKAATIPVLVTPEGAVIRDGAAIIEYFERANGREFEPPSAKQKIISTLFELIGTSGLLRPAMHYRWNYLDENREFLHYHFIHSQPEHPEREAKAQYMMSKMQNAGMLFGVTEETMPVVETLYLEFLAALNQHLTEYPYLLGWKPSIGDFGLIGPMYAHLGRDPVPLRIMQQQAVRVARWVERMNRTDQDAPEFFNPGDYYLGDDSIPETLVTVLKILAEDLMPETRAAAEVMNQWLGENQPDPGTSAQGSLARRMFGMAEFGLRGQSINAAAQSYRFVILQKLQLQYAQLSAAEQQDVTQLLQRCGLQELLTIKLDRALGWSENQDVWL